MITEGMVTEEEDREDGLREQQISLIELVRVLEAHYGVKVRAVKPSWGITVMPRKVNIGVTGIAFLWDPDPVRDVEGFLGRVREGVLMDGGEVDTGGKNEP